MSLDERRLLDLVRSTPDCCRVFIDYAYRLEGLMAFDVDVLGEVCTVRGSFTTHVSYRVNKAKKMDSIRLLLIPDQPSPTGIRIVWKSNVNTKYVLGYWAVRGGQH
jgi:hypothetical protein